MEGRIKDLIIFLVGLGFISILGYAFYQLFIR